MLQKLTFCAFKIRLNGHVLRAMFLCFILNVLFLVIDRAIAQTLTLDSKNNSTQKLFDPNGYYFPKGIDIVIEGWKIEWIDIQALEYYYDNEFHYDSPRLRPPVVRLTITRPKDQKKLAYRCPNPIVSPEVLTVSCPKTAIGAIFIKGRFLDKQGQFWNRKEVLPYKTVVLNATITVENKSGHRFFRQLPFTYWEGD